jgi:hypothetical protein
MVNDCVFSSKGCKYSVPVILYSDFPSLYLRKFSRKYESRALKPVIQTRDRVANG